MKVTLNKMVFYGYHGVYPEERVLGQRFVVTLTFSTTDSEDTKIVHLEDTVDYTKVYACVKEIMEKKTFHLLENCANEIIRVILEEFIKINSVHVIIEKPSVAINGPLNFVALEMERCR